MAAILFKPQYVKTTGHDNMARQIVSTKDRHPILYASGY